MGQLAESWVLSAFVSPHIYHAIRKQPNRTQFQKTAPRKDPLKISLIYHDTLTRSKINKTIKNTQFTDPIKLNFIRPKPRIICLYKHTFSLFFIFIFSISTKIFIIWDMLLLLLLHELGKKWNQKHFYYYFLFRQKSFNERYLFLHLKKNNSTQICYMYFYFYYYFIFP